MLFINESIFDKDDCFTIQEVVDELKDFKSKQLAEAALASKKLKTSQVSPVALELVKQKAYDVGSLNNLSETDLKVIALALQLNAKLITDDFTMQNLADHIGLKYEGVMRGEIKEKKTFR